VADATFMAPPLNATARREIGAQLAEIVDFGKERRGFPWQGQKVNEAPFASTCRKAASRAPFQDDKKTLLRFKGRADNRRKMDGWGSNPIPPTNNKIPRPNQRPRPCAYTAFL